MSTLTVLLAAFVILSHGVALFWPRKPLAVPVDETGLPVIWQNNGEQKNVACVWWEDPEELLNENATPCPAVSPIASFSESIRPLAEEVAERRTA